MPNITREMLKQALSKEPLSFEDEPLFKQYVDENSRNVWGYYDYGKYLDKLHYLQPEMGREKEVIELLEKALGIGIDDKFSGALKAIYKILGYNYFRTKDWEKAYETLENFFELTETQYIPAWAYRYRAKSRFRIKGALDAEALKLSLEDLKDSLIKEAGRMGTYCAFHGTKVAEELFIETLFLADPSMVREGDDDRQDNDKFIASLRILEQYAASLGLKDYIRSITHTMEELDIADRIEEAPQEIPKISEKPTAVPEEPFESFFGETINNQPKILTFLRTAEMAFRAFEGSPYELDGFAMTQAYQKALEKLLDEILVDPFRVRCKEVTAFEGSQNNDSLSISDRHLFKAYRYGNILTINQLLRILEVRNAPQKPGYLETFFNVIFAAPVLKNLLENKGLWGKIDKVKEKGVFDYSRHPNCIVEKDDWPMIREALIGNYTDEDCVIYQLINLRGEI